MENEERYIRATLKTILQGTKLKILEEILTQKNPNMTSISKAINESTPNIAFHINGSIKTDNGLIGLGLVEKMPTKKGVNELGLTLFGYRALDFMTGKKK